MPRSHLFKRLCQAVLCVMLVPNAWATFSIAACDPKTGECGVAVATHNLSVGHGVPFAWAEVGAGVSQFETNPCHAPAILKALQSKASAKAALEAALKADGQCDDGQDHSMRQIGVVSFDGTSAAHTGQEASGHAGQQSQYWVTVQGNGLASQAVLNDMMKTYQSTQGALSDRLMAALMAGQRAGGQGIGVLSAALLVATPNGWPVDLNLRVDFAPNTAVDDLKTLYDANIARRLLFRAQRIDDPSQAQSLIEEALQRAPGWDRIWLRAARLAQQHGDEDHAKQRACQFKSLNPVWAERMSDEFDFNGCAKSP